MALKGEVIEVKEKETKTNELQVSTDTQLGVNVEQALEDWNNYQELCRRLLDDSDFQKYVDKEGEVHEFPKKSAWFKLGRAFNVDTEIVEHTEQRTKTGRVFESYYRVRATLPNGGRSVEADASCDTFENGKKKASAHDIRGTAETRATNRAIAKLIGAGEVSSEEINSGELKKIPSNKKQLKKADEGTRVSSS